MNQTAKLQPPLIKDLPELLDEIHAGQLRVPSFQRDYLWTPEQRLDLLRSINEGIPIGSILVWQTRLHDVLAPESFETTFPTLQPVERPDTLYAFVLDGHQRLATLYRALGAGQARDRAGAHPDPPELPSDDEEAWPIFYNLREQTFELIQPNQRKKIEFFHLRADRLLDSNALFELQDVIYTQHPNERHLLHRAQHVAARFRKYQIPVLTLATDDLQVAATTFSRINSAGTDMSEADFTKALAAAQGVQLKEIFDALRGDLAALDWGNLKDTLLLQTFRALSGMKINEDQPERLVELLKDSDTLLSRSSAALQTAIRFLKEIGVPSIDFLPYALQLLLFAKRFDQDAALTPLVRSGLERWFWWTTLSEWFTGANSSTIKKAEEGMRFMEKTHLANDNALPDLLLANRRPYKHFKINAARGLAGVMRLAQLQPRDLLDKAHPPLPVHDLLARYGKDAVCSWQEMKGLPPAQKPTPASTIARYLLLDPTTARASIKRLHNEPQLISDQALVSHAFPPEAIQALRSGDLSAALELRWGYISEQERAFFDSLRS